MKKTISWLVDFEDWKKLLRSIPSAVVTLFVTSVIAMNLMANKIWFSSSICASDGGLLLSWIPFICMDITTRRYGPKAATKLNIFALITNLVFVGLFSLVANLHIGIGDCLAVNGVAEWSEYWTQFTSFDSVFRGDWIILVGSSLAFLASGIINNVLNWALGFLFTKDPDSKAAYFTRSYISTFVGQFVDNLLFATIVFMFFAPIYWGYSLTFIQCLGSSIIGAILELLMEVIFSPFGYKVYKRWVRDNVGGDYLSGIEHPGFEE